MTAVFSHGRLRLYLLVLLADGPKHGYELIRLLESRFHGLYAPSAGTIYPRLARMQADGLVTHTASGGRKVYEITEDGRTELTRRAGELVELEREIHASVADLAALAEEVEEGVRGSVRDLKRELRRAKQAAQTVRAEDWRHWRDGWPAGQQAPAAGPAANDAEDGVREAGLGARDGVREPEDGVREAGLGAREAEEGAREAGLGAREAEVARKAVDLAEDVRRLVASRRASAEDLRVAGTVLDSVRDQLRHILS